MAKIPHDKYYTPNNIVEHCVSKLKEFVGDDVTEIIEPSAGNGAFIESIDNNFNCDKYYFDLIPEHEKIKQQDFLELDLEYKQGRVIVGNPPFGTRSTLIVKFFKKSVQITDYVAFILPISQLSNTKQFEIVSANNYRINDNIPYKKHGLIKDKDGAINGKPTYARILIRRKN